MIEDSHERARAILWMLADLDPGMPILSALGHLKAIESRLDTQVRDQEKASPSKAKAASPSRYTGGQGIVNLVRDYSSHPQVRDAAKRGDRVTVATELAALSGCGPSEAIAASETLVSTLGS